MLIVLTGILFFNYVFVEYSKERIKALENFYHINEETSVIQQDYTYLLAFNWMKTLGYESNMYLPSYSYDLYNGPMTTFQESKINKMIENAYSSNFAHNVLNENVCSYFRNQTFC